MYFKTRPKLSALPPLALIACLLMGAAPFKDKNRQENFKLYLAGEFDQAKPALMVQIAADTAAFYPMDYFMLADIYLRNGETDSCKQIIALALARSEKSPDLRLQKRNAEFFTSLQNQLKNRRESLEVPLLKPLESYAEKKPDTTAAAMPTPPLPADTSAQVEPISPAPVTPDTLTASIDTVAAPLDTIAVPIDNPEIPEDTLQQSGD